MRSKVADLGANLHKLEGFVERAEASNVDLIVTPELALTGYPVSSWFSSASIGVDSPELSRLEALSRRVPMIVGLIEETEEVEFHNSAVYLSDGRVRHLHCKI